MYIRKIANQSVVLSKLPRPRSDESSNLPAKRFVFLVDSSGSMDSPIAGGGNVDTSRYIATMSIMKRIILERKSLKIAGDKLHIIEFDDAVHRVVTDVDITDFKNMKSSFSFGGMTNISLGLIAACDDIHQANTTNPLPVILFFLTDGFPNYGITSAIQLAELVKMKSKVLLDQAPLMMYSYSVSSNSDPRITSAITNAIGRDIGVDRHVQDDQFGELAREAGMLLGLASISTQISCTTDSGDVYRKMVDFGEWCYNIIPGVIVDVTDSSGMSVPIEPIDEMMEPLLLLLLRERDLINNNNTGIWSKSHNKSEIAHLQVLEIDKLNNLDPELTLIFDQARENIIDILQSLYMGISMPVTDLLRQRSGRSTSTGVVQEQFTADVQSDIPVDDGDDDTLLTHVPRPRLSRN